MKKRRGIGVFLVLLLIMGALAGCSGGGGAEEAQSEPLDISGEYAGTMTFSKVEIVYDTDEDMNGEETRTYYEPEGESEWLGEKVEVNYQVAMTEDQRVTLTSLGSDGSELTEIEGTYDQDQSTFSYVTDEIGGKNEMNLTFAEVGGIVTGKGAMVFTHTETGLVNEITIDLKRK